MADQCSHEDMVSFTAQLRAQAGAKEKLALQKELGPRTTEMTLGEALDEIMTTMQADKFWVDLAKPVSAAREALAKGATKDSRKHAAELLRATIKQVIELKHYFQVEQHILESAAALLEDAAGEASLETPLTGVKTTRSPETEAALAKGVEEENAKRDKAIKATEGPWEFIEITDKTEVTVNFPVPADTKKADIEVTFRDSSLTVKVTGHQLQPAVVDGELAGKIDPDACAWTLEGTGAGRKLVLELEKTMGGLMWTRLLALPH